MLPLLTRRESHPHLSLLRGLANGHVVEVGAVGGGHVAGHLADQLVGGQAATVGRPQQAAGVHHKGGGAVNEGVRRKVLDLPSKFKFSTGNV